MVRRRFARTRVLILSALKDTQDAHRRQSTVGHSWNVHATWNMQYASWQHRSKPCWAWFQLQISRVLHKNSLQFVAPSGCPFYNPTDEKILYLKLCNLSTNEDICDRKTVSSSADLYETSDSKRILLKRTRAAQFKQFAYFLNRPRRAVKLTSPHLPQHIWLHLHKMVQKLSYKITT